MAKSNGPRVSRFMGMVEHARIEPDGTWLEPEAFCYPHGGMTRRARVHTFAGLRVVVCGIPDTFFSIPARMRVCGKTLRGFISSGDYGLHFNAYTE